jgi:hypothetical protein
MCRNNLFRTSCAAHKSVKLHGFNAQLGERLPHTSRVFPCQWNISIHSLSEMKEIQGVITVSKMLVCAKELARNLQQCNVKITAPRSV